jgi:hypothetical protein
MHVNGNGLRERHRTATESPLACAFVRAKAERGFGKNWVLRCDPDTLHFEPREDIFVCIGVYDFSLTTPPGRKHDTIHVLALSPLLSCVNWIASFLVGASNHTRERQEINGQHADRNRVYR